MCSSPLRALQASAFKSRRQLKESQGICSCLVGDWEGRLKEDLRCCVSAPTRKTHDHAVYEVMFRQRKTVLPSEDKCRSETRFQRFELGLPPAPETLRAPSLSAAGAIAKRSQTELCDEQSTLEKASEASATQQTHVACEHLATFKTLTLGEMAPASSSCFHHITSLT